MKTRSIATAAALVVGLGAGSAVAGPIGYVLSTGGTTLVSFGVNTPGNVSTVALGGDGSRLDAIDFRPATGQLYGYDDVGDQYFVVDPVTGALTNASGTVAATNTQNLDIDWNPTIDRMRTVTDTDQNIVYNPDTGDASDAATTPLFYGVGDANEGADPSVTANAYDNSFAGSTVTTQYVLDYGLDVLATLANNAGTLSTVGSLGLDIDPAAGLDILFNNGTNTAYALLTVGGVAGIYTIDLLTGAATSIGAVASSQFDVTGLAVAAVPAPGMLALFGLAGLGLCVARRRKASA